KRLASAGADGPIRLWDVAGKGVVRALKGHDGTVRSLAFSSDGRRLVSGAEDGTVRLWDAADGKQLALSRQNDVVREAAFSPRARSLAVVSEDRSLRLLAPESLAQRAVRFQHAQAATCLAYSPDGRALYTGGSDRAIRRWQAAAEEVGPVVTFRTQARQM